MWLSAPANVMCFCFSVYFPIVTVPGWRPLVGCEEGGRPSFRSGCFAVHSQRDISCVLHIRWMFLKDYIIWTTLNQARSLNRDEFYSWTGLGFMFSTHCRWFSQFVYILKFCVLCIRWQVNLGNCIQFLMSQHLNCYKK